jgi:hypothetical protein
VVRSTLPPPERLPYHLSTEAKRGGPGVGLGEEGAGRGLGLGRGRGGRGLRLRRGGSQQLEDIP